MGYQRMKIEDLKSIFRRFHANQNISNIATLENRDRKTIREYVKLFVKNGYSPGCEMPSNEHLIDFFKTLLPVTVKESLKSGDLNNYKEYIGQLITDKKEAVKIKTAYQIICSKYGWNGSYETFKIFVRKNNLVKESTRKTIRIELPQGLETQIDYGKVGIYFDKRENRNRSVNAFCGVLSYSRFPFIEYTYSQNQEEFATSFVNMNEFYEGVTEYISLDNLKSGVIKPDLYDPKINKSFEEVADYYGIFVNPCRVAHPKDKAKVERFVPSARELFRMLKHLHPNENLLFLNNEAKKWCKEVYGMKEHGTTGIPPYILYKEEKEVLKSLPEKRFIVCKWKKAKVRPDQFFGFEKKNYSLPAKYIQKEVWVKKDGVMIYIYFDFELIRAYLIPIGLNSYLKNDFPEVIREMLDGGYPKYLLGKSRKYGENARRLIENILSPHAYLNARRAQGILGILEEYKSHPYFEDVLIVAIHKQISVPKTLKTMFDEETQQKKLDFHKEASETQKAMIRDPSYYFS